MTNNLRLRASSQQPEPNVADDNVLQFPPPPSSPNQPLTMASGSPASADSRQSKKRRAKLTSTKTILAAMLSLSVLMLLPSGRIHSRLSRRLNRPSYHGWGWEPNLRQRRGSNGGGRFPPRVVANLDLPLSVKPNKPSVFSSIYKLFHRQRIVQDEMLHHDGWKEMYEVDEEGASTLRWLDLSFWRHEQIQQEAEEKECVPMVDWQTTSYPNCNVVHEIDMVLSSSLGSRAYPAHSPKQQLLRRQITDFPSIPLNHLKHYSDKDYRAHKYLHLNAKGIMKEEDLTFLGQGWFRSAWKMDQSLPGVWDEEEEEWIFEESVVLKTLRIEREFLEEYYELHRRDALAMERLTFSPYVLDIYGYCGQSAINELANFGIEGLASLEKIARQFRGVEVEPVNKIKLQLASMVSAGVSHMHSIDYPDHIPSENANEIGPPRKSNATLVHYDLNPRNVAIVKRGKPKINDFNVAEFLTWDTRHNTTCGFTGRFREPWWRAPEEMHFHDPSFTNPSPLTEKVDIYSLGNILMTILTSHSPRGQMTKELMEEIRPKVARGELPKLPSDFNETYAAADPALSPIIKAMYKCLQALPEDRPSAGEIAEELAFAVDNLPEDYGDKEKFYNSVERVEMRKKLKKSKSSKQ